MALLEAWKFNFDREDEGEDTVECFWVPDSSALTSTVMDHYIKVNFANACECPEEMWDRVQDILSRDQGVFFCENESFYRYSFATENTQPGKCYANDTDLNVLEYSMFEFEE